MNQNTNSSSLGIEIPDDMKDIVSSIDILEDFQISATIKGKDGPVFKSIVLKKINKRLLLDWEKTMAILCSQLKESGVIGNSLNRMSSLLARNHAKITDYVGALIKKSEGESEDGVSSLSSQKKQKIKVFKYYSEKEQILYESVVLGGKPCFVFYENDKTNTIDSIEEVTRTLIPFGLDDGPAKPYEFESIEEINKLINEVKQKSISDFYKKTKLIVTKYVDQKPMVINIISIDLLFSYFQDRFPTTHYLFFVGNNGVGKSVIGELFELIAYRGVMMTDPSAANIYRLLGKVQPAQCTMIMDEIENIDGNQAIMNILKTGYTTKGKVPKINTNTLDQEFFNTYSLKVFLSERLPHNYTARGVLDRTFAITCLLGSPKYNIKDVLVSQGKQGNQSIKELDEEINELRKTLFIYRLINAYEERPEIDTGLENRPMELCEGLGLFYGSEVQEEVEETFQHFLDVKYEQKITSFDHFLLLRIIEELDKSEDKCSFAVRDLWHSILRSTHYQEGNENEVYLTDFGFKLYYNQLSTKCKIFGAESKHTNTGNILIFKASSKIRHTYQQLSKKPKISCSLVKRDENKSEDSEGREGSGEGTLSFFDERNRSY
ncbi:MAG: hypothetical protein L0H53_12750 [Candidatus Nitrosocosmicus sp.]|nr:hypothetical protein [Candidatus Nitrosocosmicus sp.]MDN5868378.1 hypothetical protein [Candidatus Nitrosocosmicus sp.]